MTPKALLLDLDDTLIDTRLGTRLALQDFHGSHGHLIGIGLEEAQARWQRGLEVHFPRYLAGEITFQEQRRGRLREMFAKPEMPDEEADALFRIYLGHYSRHYFLFDDVLDFLDGLKGFPIAIVTNGSESHQMVKIRATGLEGRVRVIVISEVVGLRKPQKEIFLHAAAQLGTDPADCLMVGDNPEADCLGALGAGMNAVLMNRFGTATIPDGMRAVSRLRDILG